jgi:hypothetical protein
MGGQILWGGTNDPSGAGDPTGDEGGIRQLATLYGKVNISIQYSGIPSFLRMAGVHPDA